MMSTIGPGIDRAAGQTVPAHNSRARCCVNEAVATLRGVTHGSETGWRPASLLFPKLSIF
ncbi:protein of unknown function [Methylorubrum extorquens DM4]|uniref:Uncharacterized protein n=1 Tax=Methylorubrum extorquens (strain DSM 6343 / CIP 106787 / DM4) TaxID=661410 RepID=C7CIJ2_METED|nr:protein of unknown function [Methylorubrum extorquens DM4]